MEKSLVSVLLVERERDGRMKRATAKITVARKKIAKEKRLERSESRYEERGKKEWWVVLLKKLGVGYIESGYAVPGDCMGEGLW